MEQQPLGFFEQVNRWLRESVMVKLASIGLLVIVLLIPSAWVQSIMQERQSRVHEVFSEVSGKWSDSQRLTGPVLVLPYKYRTTRQVNGVTEVIDKTKKAYFLPEQLNIRSQVEPQVLNRGIYDVVVYNSHINMDGKFAKPDLAALQIAPEDVMWQDAYVLNGISDLRGIGEQPTIRVDGLNYVSEPGNEANTAQSPDDNNAHYKLFSNSIMTKLKLGATEPVHELPFTMQLSLKGSGQLFFVPAGKATTVQIKGNWGNPSFDGYYLPETRSVSETDFAAVWKVLHFNRPFPQQWAGAAPDLDEAAFGVNMIMPVDQYQKSMRTAKYGVLLILLTFISLFLMELMTKMRIHPFQYILIGVALVIYYSLLLSISEHTGYVIGYWVATGATVLLISLYSTTFVPTKKTSALLGFLLLIFYGYIFTITQQQDYALLLGSVGLFVIIAVLMYVSRKVNWNLEGSANETPALPS